MTKFLIKFLCLFIPAKSLRTKFKNCFAATRKPPCRHVGRHTYLGASVFVSHKETSIGSFCSIAGNTAIGPSQHPLNFLSTHPFQYLGHDKLQPEHKADFVFARPVAVGNDVWIGANVVIMTDSQSVTARLSAPMRLLPGMFRLMRLSAAFRPE